MPIHTIKLLDRATIANQTIDLTFEKPDGFSFVAGQYGGFTLINPTETDDKGATRRFSFLSAPDDPHIRIVTRIQTSAYKRNLEKMEPGATIKLAGPTGNFVLHADQATPAVMIAGGIGITPFYSMIHYALRHEPARMITLFYGNQTLADSALLAELNQLSQRNINFKMIPVLANPHPEWEGEKGFITDEILVKHIPDLDQPIFYVCGSPAMVNAMQQMLRELQIANERVKVEDFPGY